MKKVILSVLVLLSLKAFAQEKVKPEFTKTVPVQNTGGGRVSPEYVFQYKDETCMLSWSLNLKVSFFYVATTFEPYSSGIVLYRMGQGKRGKAKTEVIKLPTDNYFYNYVGAWYKENTLNIYYGCKNKAQKKYYVFCTRYHMDTKKSEHFKVFETKLRNSIWFQISEGEEYSMLAGSDEKSHDKAPFDYLVADHNLQPIDGGSNVALNDKDPLRIESFLLSSKGDLVVKGVTKKPRKSILKARTYGHPIFVVKNEKANVIEFESDNNYMTKPVVFFNKKGELNACFLYGEDRKTAGISLVEVDLDKAKEKHSTVYGLNGSESDLDKKRRNTEFYITGVQTTDDGNTMILAEEFNVRVRTTTTSSRSGTTTKTTTYFDYGPGKIYTFNSDFENTTTCKLNYKVTYANNDLGYGIRFIGLPGNIAYLYSDNAFYKYRLSNGTFTGKPAMTMKTGMKALFGHYSKYVQTKKKAYIFDIKKRTSINFQEYTLVP